MKNHLTKNQLLKEVIQHARKNQFQAFRVALKAELQKRHIRLSSHKKALFIKQMYSLYPARFTSSTLNRNTVNLLIESFFQVIGEHLKKGERVMFRGFGIFNVHTLPKRLGHNPLTNRKIVWKARKVLKFKAGKTLRKLVNHELKAKDNRYWQTDQNRTLLFTEENFARELANVERLDMPNPYTPVLSKKQIAHNQALHNKTNVDELMIEQSCLRYHAQPVFSHLAFERCNGEYFTSAHNKSVIDALTIGRSTLNYQAHRQVTTKLSAMRHHRSILKWEQIKEDNAGKFDKENEKQN